MKFVSEPLWQIYLYCLPGGPILQIRGRQHAQPQYRSNAESTWSRDQAPACSIGSCIHLVML